MPSILNEAIKPSLIDIESERAKAQMLAEYFTAILRNNDPDNAADNGDRMRGILSYEYDISNFQFFGEFMIYMLSDALYNIAQWEVFLRIIYNELIKSSHQIQTLNLKLDEIYKHIQSAVQTRTAVPTRQVYPLFIKLAELWTFFQEEIVLLSVFQNIRTNAKEFIKNQEVIFPLLYLEKATSNVTVQSMEQYIANAKVNDARISSGTGRSTQEGNDINWIYPDSLSHNMKFEQLTFRFRSFCPFMLAEHGLLIPGSADIGILCYDEGFYVFSSVEAAHTFSSNISNMMEKINERARHSTELINLVQLQRQFQNLASNESTLDKRQPRLQTDSGTQTDTHINEPNIDKDYEWNEWEMRRKALKLANLRKCITHSTQTILSNFRRENETQVYPPKENNTQTKRDGETMVPKHNIYYAGLRGKKEPESFVQVDITDYRDVDPK